MLNPIVVIRMLEILIIISVLGAVAWILHYVKQRNSEQHSGITNFHMVDQKLFRSGQPSSAQYRILEKSGIREVLSLRFYHDNFKKLTGTALKFHRIPTKASKITENEIIDALRVIMNSPGPILVHCWHGSDRTGIVVAFYRMIFHGLSKEDAIEELTKGGYGYHSVFDNIIETIEKADIEQMKELLEIGSSDMRMAV